MISPIGGMTMSLTSEVMTFPNAAPMMTPTARSITLPRAANALNSLNIAPPGVMLTPPIAKFFAGCYFRSTFSPPSPSKPSYAHDESPGFEPARAAILDILYQRGQATAAEVQLALHEPPSYSAVRALLRILEEKGHVRHEQDGPRYVYLPTVNRDRARKSAMKHLVRTFFDGSTEDAVAALLQNDGMSDAELQRLSRLIEAAKREGR